MSLDLQNPAIRAKLDRLNNAVLEAKRQRDRDIAASVQRLQRARSHFPSFLEAVMKDEETNQLIRLAEIHLTWIDHIDYCWQRGLIAAILAPWGFGKTAIMEAIPLFLFGYDPSLRIKMVSSSDGLAKKRVGKIREYIEESAEYHELFPHVKQNKKLPWTRTEIFLQRATRARDASLEAMGIMSDVLGGRADVMLFDDINSQKNTITNPNERPKVFENFTTTFLGRRTASARVAYIGTRWHEDDVYGLVMADERLRKGYGWLVQRIYESCEDIECSYYYPDDTEPPTKSRLDDLFAIAERDAA